MTTIAERIVAISGLSGVSVNAHLLAFPGSSGGTIAERIHTRSTLGTATVAAHLMDAGPVGPEPGLQILIPILRRRRR